LEGQWDWNSLLRLKYSDSCGKSSDDSLRYKNNLGIEYLRRMTGCLYISDHRYQWISMTFSVLDRHVHLIISTLSYLLTPPSPVPQHLYSWALWPLGLLYTRFDSVLALLEWFHHSWSKVTVTWTLVIGQQGICLWNTLSLTLMDLKILTVW